MHRTKQTEGNGMPTFARPLVPSRALPAASAPSVLSPAMTFVSLATLSCAALFLFARPDGAQNLPVSKSSVTAHKQASAVAKTTPSDESAGAGKEDRQDLSFYTNNVRDGMFSAPVPPTPKEPVVVKPTTLPHIILPTIDPFADWTYTGTVHIGDNTVALLENRITGEGKYVKSGDNFMGAKIKSVTDQSVSITPADKASKQTMLAKSDTIIVTPLNYDAPGKNPPQQQAQNGQQTGQPVALASTNPNQPTVLGKDGTPITDPNVAARYQNRLNRGFGGGGNNGGGGFGGGGGGGRRGGGGGNRGAFGGGG